MTNEEREKLNALLAESEPMRATGPEPDFPGAPRVVDARMWNRALSKYELRLLSMYAEETRGVLVDKNGNVERYGNLVQADPALRPKGIGPGGEG
jgi:hypothetical protein